MVRKKFMANAVFKCTLTISIAVPQDKEAAAARYDPEKKPFFLFLFFYYYFLRHRVFHVLRGPRPQDVRTSLHVSENIFAFATAYF
jgi:hypothetical protein